ALRALGARAARDVPRAADLPPRARRPARRLWAVARRESRLHARRRPRRDGALPAHGRLPVREGSLLARGDAAPPGARARARSARAPGGTALGVGDARRR